MRRPDDPQPVADLGCLTIDCGNAGVLAAFYVDALDARYDGERNGFHYARLPHLALCLRPVEGFVPPA